MNIRFGPDMTLTSVEVITPQLETIHRFALAAGDEIDVDVPSAESFIRLRLPSGRSVILRHSGNLTYFITRRSFSRDIKDARQLAAGATVGDLRQYNQTRSMEVSDAPTFRSMAAPVLHEQVDADLPTSALPGGFTVTWKPAVGGTVANQGEEILFAPSTRMDPYELLIKGPRNFRVRMPGNIESAFIRSDLVGGEQYVVSVRVATSSPDADTVGSYLAQSDYFSAETMTEWAKQAEHMLQMKGSDPYAATVAAYLLLRLERFDLLHDWPRNLANLFPSLPDGCIIWAAQCALERKDRAESLDYIAQGMQRGLPVYTEGLHRLSRILRLLGDDGRKYLQEMGDTTQGVVWNSPFTTLTDGFGKASGAVSIDIAYASKL
jgi:hypothetical protein